MRSQCAWCGTGAQELKLRVEEMEEELRKRHALELESISISADSAGDTEGAAAASPADDAAAEAAEAPAKGPSRAAVKREKKKAADAAERAEIAAYKATVSDPRVEELAAMERFTGPAGLMLHEVPRA